MCTSPSDRHSICIKLRLMNASTMLFSNINIVQYAVTLTCIACGSFQSPQTSFCPYYSNIHYNITCTIFYELKGTRYLLAHLAFTTVFFPHTPNTLSTIFGLFWYRCCCCVLQHLACPISAKKVLINSDFNHILTVLTCKVGAFFQVLHVLLYLCIKYTIDIAHYHASKV